MATALNDIHHETRSERLVVLVSPTEKRSIEARARDAKLSISDYVRWAAKNEDIPTEAEKALMTELVSQLETINLRTDATLARLEATNAAAAAFDEAAYKAKLKADWERDGVVDWAKLRAAFAGAGFGG